MNVLELKKLVMSGESETLEWKETTGQRTEAARTLCAFLNGKGGMVVFGVSRKGTITGQAVSDSTRRDLFEAFLKFEPAVDIGVEMVPLPSGLSAIVCTVQTGAHRPYLYDGRAYRRVQSSTAVMPQDMYESLLVGRGGFQSDWERRPNPELTLSDLDQDEIIRTARMSISAGRLDASADTTDAMSLLNKFGLARKGIIFNGAAVLFGKDFSLYPQCHLKMAWFKGTDKRHFLDSADLHDNIFRLFDAALAFCFKHLNLSGEVSGMYRDERLEIPFEALREAIINALAHRLYVIPGSAVSLAIYEDRLEIVNPGAFPPDLSLDNLAADHESEPRNPRIAEVLYRRKTIEAWGRGFNVIFDACAKVGVPNPRFECDGRFVRTVFPRVAISMRKTVERESPQVTPQVAPNTPQATPQVSPHTPQVSPNTPQATPQVAIQPLQRAGQPHLKQSTGIATLLLLALQTDDLGIAQLMAYVDIRNRKYFRQRYITPALQAGWIVQTVPEAPRSPMQKYRLTDKGRGIIASGTPSEP